MRTIGVIVAFLLLCGLPAVAETVFVEAGRDATLIEDPDGARANGSGPVFFAGRTNQQQNGIRRALVYFDVAGSVPRHAIIENVSLRLFQTAGNDEMREVRLHRVLAGWGEGPSSSSGGGGAPALPGDATWLHQYYDHEYWVHSGGQFVGRVSGRQDVGPDGFYTWESNVHLVQDVRLWFSNPENNFGWILIGDETVRQSAKRLASRENPDLSIRPLLEISYRLPRGR